MANLGYIQITRECNQLCRFCSNPPSGQSATAERIRTQVDDLLARGCDGLILTGGEPTLFEELPALISYATRRGAPCRIITNGQLLAEGDLLEQLVDAGLRHLHVSLYSHRADVQDMLTRNPGSWDRIQRTLARLGSHPAGLTVDLNVVINHYNADHLHRVAHFVVRQLPFVRHMVFNNLDPSMNRTAEFPDTIPKLWELEVSLLRALRALEAAGVTFRVERIPLCYMVEYAHVSTETRKIVKEEPRLIHFLDDKRLVCQHERAAWERGKAPQCGSCHLDPICAGLDSMDEHYSSKELYPVFADPAVIIRKIRG
jgi:MoaA/NifB/PqqE/SkfB family radical SAM enzyme